MAAHHQARSYRGSGGRRFDGAEGAEGRYDLLVDRSRREWAEPDIIAVRIDGSVIVVRAAHDTAGQRLMATDNPDWPNVPLPAGAEIVGRALCVARALY